ncbi:hypothetical protein RRG08_053148 [Elysia crispata]|uniref:Uncharacterized protein n=1 Tax=Elysia crispata TaxID=231223 RepID=A0AAE1A9P6_9GAST|nr:hypothetical protein RRG08_053148 [Elysia crispata]
MPLAVLGAVTTGKRSCKNNAPRSSHSDLDSSFCPVRHCTGLWQPQIAGVIRVLKKKKLEYDKDLPFSAVSTRPALEVSRGSNHVHEASTKDQRAEIPHRQTPELAPYYTAGKTWRQHCLRRTAAHLSSKPIQPTFSVIFVSVNCPHPPVIRQ